MNIISGFIDNILVDSTISPTASQNVIINPTFTPSVIPTNPSNACPYFSTTRTKCYFTDINEKSKYLCNQNCGGIDLSIRT